MSQKHEADELRHQIRDLPSRETRGRDGNFRCCLQFCAATEQNNDISCGTVRKQTGKGRQAHNDLLPRLLPAGRDKGRVAVKALHEAVSISGVQARVKGKRAHLIHAAIELDERSAS
jgi:hypothetical protein